VEVNLYNLKLKFTDRAEKKKLRKVPDIFSGGLAQIFVATEKKIV
jgi:hypothetical protein